MTDDEKIGSWLQSFQDFAIAEIKQALDDREQRLQVGLVILVLLHTEALGGYLAGQKSQKSPTFVTFVKRYFPERYHPYAEDLYRLRNGLAHDYITKGDFVMTGKKGEDHFVRGFDGNASYTVINRVELAEDFIDAWKRYSADVRSDPELRNNALARIKVAGFMMVGYLRPKYIEIRLEPPRETSDSAL